jgi:hypothetical protein
MLAYRAPIDAIESPRKCDQRATSNDGQFSNLTTVRRFPANELRRQRRRILGPDSNQAIDVSSLITRRFCTDPVELPDDD